MQFVPLGLSLLFLSATAQQAEGATSGGPFFSPEIEQRARDLVGQMTVDEKIGQMMQVDFLALAAHPDDVTRLALGSVLNGGSSDPPDNSPGTWADAVDALQKRALATRLKIPLLYGIDAVHGHNNVLGAVIFPHNLGLGATRDAALVERAARITAREVVATGPNWAFGPGVIVGRDERWGRSYESFGEQPELVATLGAAAIRGFQTNDLSGSASVLACAKHFLGDGGTTNGVDQGNTEVDEATLRRLFLPPYVEAIRAGVGSIMVSYSSWNGEKMHGQRHLLTEVLKGELGFSGFLVSDWAAIDQLPGDYSSQIERSLNAGLDMIMIPSSPQKKNSYLEFARRLHELVQQGRVSEARINDAVLRILRVKLAMGLFQRPLANRALLDEIGSPEHRAVARECVQRSLVLLKNEQAVLPFKPALRRLLVMGPAADDLGVQCGGWTISWQGSHGDVTPGGTSILDGLRQVAPPNCQISYDAEGQTQTEADAVVVVIGEEPYAEGKGDRKDLNLTASDLERVRRARSKNVPLVLILLSGRPLILGEALDRSDAVVAAWLPGTEGAGVADLLFGKTSPTGRLPVSWPRTMAQIPINVGDAHYDPLFPYGFGLSY